MSRTTRRAILAAGVLLASAGAALAAAHASTGSYSGSTSERSAVSFKIVSNGAAITNFTTMLGYNGKCGQGGGPGYTAAAKRIPIGAGGKFKANITLRFNAKVHAPGQISGTASRSTVRGTVLQLLKGKPNKCYTETFTAHKV
jgi:hypothetical protein